MSRHRRRFRERPGVMAGLIALVAGFSAARGTDLDAPPRFDGAGYAVLGKALASGRGYREIDHPDAPGHGHFPPGYPSVLAVLWSWTGPSERAAHLASLVFTAAAAVTAWKWFRGLFGRRVAGLLGLAVAVNWTWARQGGSIQSEPLYLLLGTLTLLGARAVGRRGTRASGIGLGALLAALILTRHVGGALALAVGLDLIARRKAGAAVAAGLTCLALISPWVAWLVSVREHTQAELFLQGGLMGRVAGQAWFYLLRLPDQLTGPFVEVATVFRGPGPLTVLAITWALLASGLILGGWLRLSRSPRRRLAALTPILTLGLLLVWPFTEAGRFLVPLVPFLVVGATEGLAGVLGRLGIRRARRTAAALVLLVSLPYSIYALIGDRSAVLRGTYADFDAACAWLASEGGEPGPILTRHPGEVYWLTGRNALAPASTDPSVVEALVDRQRVSYLLIDEARYANAPDNPLSLFVQRRPERVREVWRRDSGGASTVIYAVKST